MISGIRATFQIGALLLLLPLAGDAGLSYRYGPGNH
jgi:hypothetical protein